MSIIIKNQDIANPLDIYIRAGKRIVLPSGGELNLLTVLTYDEIYSCSDLCYHVENGDIVVNDGRNDLSAADGHKILKGKQLSYSKYDATAGEFLPGLKAVYLSGSEEVKLARADSESNVPTVGFTKFDAYQGDTLTVYTNDILDGFTGLTPAADYYLSQDAYGDITTTKPTSGIIVRVGYAINTTMLDIHLLRLSHPLDDIETVELSSPTNGELLVQENGSWVNKTLADAGIAVATDLATHEADSTLHRIINDAGTSATELWSASKIDSMVSGVSGDSISEEFTKTSHGLTVGEVVRHAGPNPEDWTEAKADTNDNSEALGIVSVVSGNDFTVTYSGRISGLSGLTAGTNFLSDVTAGTMTTTEPTISKPVLYATSATSGIVLIERGMTGAAAANDLNDIDDVTITSVAAGELIKWNGAVWANNTLAEAGVAAASHNHAAADMNSGTLADARIAASNVTQHEAALTVTESQISDLGSYSTTSHTHVSRLGHTYAISGEVKVPSGDTDFILPFFVSFASGQTAKLVKARHVINAGTSVTCKLQKNDSDVTGFTGITVNTTASNTDPSDVTLANDDKLALVVTAVAGTPKNMTFTMFIEVTQ